MFQILTFRLCWKYFVLETRPPIQTPEMLKTIVLIRDLVRLHSLKFSNLKLTNNYLIERTKKSRCFDWIIWNAFTIFDTVQLFYSKTYVRAAVDILIFIVQILNVRALSLTNFFWLRLGTQYWRIILIQRSRY